MSLSLLGLSLFGTGKWANCLGRRDLGRHAMANDICTIRVWRHCEAAGHEFLTPILFLVPNPHESSMPGARRIWFGDFFAQAHCGLLGAERDVTTHRISVCVQQRRAPKIRAVPKRHSRRGSVRNKRHLPARRVSVNRAAKLSSADSHPLLPLSLLGCLL